MSLDQFENSVKLALLDLYDLDAPAISWIVITFAKELQVAYCHDDEPRAAARELMLLFLEHEPVRAKKR